MISIDMDSIRQSAVTSLRKQATAIENSSPSVSSTHLQIRETDFRVETDAITLLDKKLSANKGSNYLYIFSFDPKSVKPTAIIAAIGKVKKNAKSLKKDWYPRINKAACKAEASVLYVGSSSDITHRLLEHFGHAYDRTYGLRLRDWLPAGCQLDLQVYDLGSLPRDILTALEDTIWDEHKPILGRKGRT